MVLGGIMVSDDRMMLQCCHFVGWWNDVGSVK